MNNFTKRILTGVSLVIVILAAVWFGGFSFAILLLLINWLGLREFYQLLETAQIKPSRFAGGLLSACLIISCFAALSYAGNWKWLLLNLPVAFGIFVAALYKRNTKPFVGLAITFLGIICISLPLCFFLLIAFLPLASGYHFQIPLGVFFLLWANDTGAYLIGSIYGKHALFSRISPKKTWEGSLAGAAFALITGYILSFYNAFLTILQWEVLSLIIIISGTYGDLIKSMLKRSLKVKDSGTILPGHGGILDRFDSLLGAAPFVFIYLLML